VRAGPAAPSEFRPCPGRHGPAAHAAGAAGPGARAARTRRRHHAGSHRHLACLGLDPAPDGRPACRRAQLPPRLRSRSQLRGVAWRPGADRGARRRQRNRGDPGQEGPAPGPDLHYRPLRPVPPAGRRGRDGAGQPIARRAVLAGGIARFRRRRSGRVFPPPARAPFRRGAELMDADVAMSLMAQTLLGALKVAAPVLVTALVVGLGISVLQVVTQVQEMTLTFVPKLIAVVLVCVLLGGWMVSVTVE